MFSRRIIICCKNKIGEQEKLNILYGSEGCNACQTAKVYLNALDIEYEYIDIRRDKATTETFLKEFRVRTIPVFKTDKGFAIGFNPGKYQKIL